LGVFLIKCLILGLAFSKLKIIKMKKSAKVLLLFLISGLMVFTSCNCIEGQGPLKTKTISLGGFDEVDLQMGADVLIRQDSFFSISVTAQENLLDIILTEVSGDKLKIKTKENCIRSSKKIKVYINMPIINGLKLNGSGEIKSEGSITTDDLYIDINGSGDVILNVVANKIESEISGSGKVLLSGTARKHLIGISGSGDVNAYDLDAYKVDAKITGSGNIYVKAHKSLNAHINGSGSVFYKGSPDIKSRISGSGSLVKK
jgi:predicted small secreted protein